MIERATAILSRLKDERGLGGRTELARQAAALIEKLLAENEQLRRTGDSTDGEKLSEDK